MTEDYKNILIIKPSSLGDIVMALPGLSALRKSYPTAKISWLVRPEFAGLLQNHPLLDEIIIFDRKVLGKAWKNLAAAKAFCSLIGKLRGKKFDLVIDLQCLFRSGALSWLTGCKKRVGMAGAREFASMFYTQKIPQTKEDIHIVDFCLKIVGSLGADISSPEFVLPRDESAENSMKKLLAEHDVPANNYAVMVVGSAHNVKCWPAEKFAKLADMIHTEFGMDMVAIGTKGESESAEAINRLSKSKIVNLAGKTGLAELVALMRGAKLVAGNDTGPGHIAFALGRPLVMIYGHSNPARVGTYKKPECMVAVDMFDRGLTYRSSDPAHDVANISVDQVFEKVRKQLEK